MASPFKIPKKKQPAGCDSICMQSPLSRLQSSTSVLKQSSYGAQSSRGGADAMHAGNTFGSTRQRGPCEPIVRDVVKTLLRINSPNPGAPAANHRATGGSCYLSAPGQKAESNSFRFSNRWRPKRASDRLLQPIGTAEPPSLPQKKKSDLRGSFSVTPPPERISVVSLDSLAELRGERHAGSSSAGRESGGGNSSESLNQREMIFSLSSSDQTSGDDFVSQARSRNKPSAVKASPRGTPPPSPVPSRTTADRRPGRAGPLPSGSGLTEDLRETERRRWMEFREKKRPSRSAVLHLQPRKSKQTPTEPIVLSSEEEEDAEGDDDGVRGQSLGRSDRAEESCAGSREQLQAQLAPPSKGGTDRSPPPPTSLQLGFSSLHAGLMHADASGELMITENGINIPVKGGEEGELAVVASHVQGYGVWDGGVARDGTLLAGRDGPAPSLIFLWVTDAQANLLQMELTAMQTSPTASGPSCCFLLLVLKEQLQELQAALLASIMDMKEYRRASSGRLTSPLEWTDGLLLLHNCPPPLDQHLLRLLGCSAEKSTNSQKTRRSSQRSSALQQLSTRLIQYPAAPCKGRITVTKDDLACLDEGEFLNDVIIDFYLKYLLSEGGGGSVAKRSHVFSSFFYQQLSRRRFAGQSDAPIVPDRYTRHQRVKTWTRHVDIFTKDFLFVPVNQEAHWFLVLVCFPGLEDFQYEAFQSQTGAAERAAGKPSVGPGAQQLPECLLQTCRRDRVLKRPCMLVMDSLKLSHHENVCRLLRDYLQVEWEVRRGTPRLFRSDSMRSFSCRVPRQDNSSDCGLYLLQYAESFLQNPVVHFDLPLGLNNWFPRQQARQKREEIRGLVMRMHCSQNGDT